MAGFAVMKIFRRVMLAALLILAAPLLAGQTLVVNANGYSIDKKGKVQRFSTLLIGEDGKVVSVLRKGKSEPKLSDGDYRLDVKGKTLLPGLIETHGQILRQALLMRGFTPETADSASPVQRELALIAYLDKLPTLGVTGVHDMGTTAADWALLRSLGDAGRLNVRITAYADDMPAMEAIAPLRPTPWLYEGRLRLQGIFLRADNMGAADTRMKNLFSRSNYFGYQVAVEATDPVAITRVLDSFAVIRPAYGGKYRNRIEQAQNPAPADLERLAELETLMMAPTRPGTPPFALLHAALLRGEDMATALASLTTGAAFAGHADDAVGSLAPGKWADFILVDQDPFAIAPESVPAIRVEETWLAGKRLFQATR
ncbi:MAG: amidohydrolase family protein [Sphingomonadaceae bacterium]